MKTCVVPIPGGNLVVLGRTWLKQYNPSIDWKERTLLVRREDGSTLKFTPNDVSTRTPEVHIKKISMRRKKALVRRE